MKLDEKHKQFAVKYFARFMTRAEVVEALKRQGVSRFSESFNRTTQRGNTTTHK